MAKKENKNENKVKKHFLKDLKVELKKVIWPTPKQLVNNTVAVVTIVLLTAAIVFVLDVVFDMGNKYGISKLQSLVNEKYNNEEDTDNADSVDGNKDNTDEENSSNNETTEDDSTVEDVSNGENAVDSNSDDNSQEDLTANNNEQSSLEQ